MALEIGTRWMLWSEDVPPEVVDLSLFPDFVDRMWWVLVQGSRGHPSASTHKASLAMMLLWIQQWWSLGVSSNVCLGGVGVWWRLLVSASAGIKPWPGIVIYFSIF
jgi:hypothetical protein